MSCGVQNGKAVVDCDLSGVTPMGSGWANPRAPVLRGHPQGAPFTQAFQLILLFHKGAPFQHFPTVLLRNSHNDAFHKLIKWQNYLSALWKGRGGGGWGSNFTYVSYNTGMCSPNGWILHKKSINMGLISTPPPKKIPKRRLVKFVENRVQKSWRKFWKIGRPT